jgi:Flp pilus assembly pilin Flp
MSSGACWRGVRVHTRRVKARAQGLTEYGLILTFVAFVAIVALTLFGQGLGDQLASLLSNLGTSV